MSSYLFVDVRQLAVCFNKFFLLASAKSSQSFFFNAMKFSVLLSSLVVVLPLLSQASGGSVAVLVNRQFQNNPSRQGNNRGSRKGGTGNSTQTGGSAAGNTTNTGGNAGNVTTTGSISGTAGNVTNTGGTAGNVTNIAGTAGNVTNNGGTASNVTNAGGNPQTSLSASKLVTSLNTFESDFVFSIRSQSDCSWFRE